MVIHVSLPVSYELGAAHRMRVPLVIIRPQTILICIDMSQILNVGVAVF